LLAQALRQKQLDKLVLLLVPLLSAVWGELLRCQVLAALAEDLLEQVAVLAAKAGLLLPFSAVLLAVAVRVDTPEMAVKAQLMAQVLVLVAHNPALEVRAVAVLVVAGLTLVVAVVAV
jgi:hypothetical protein